MTTRLSLLKQPLISPLFCVVGKRSFSTGSSDSSDGSDFDIHKFMNDFHFYMKNVKSPEDALKLKACLF